MKDKNGLPLDIGIRIEEDEGWEGDIVEINEEAQTLKVKYTLTDEDEEGIIYEVVPEKVRIAPAS